MREVLCPTHTEYALQQPGGRRAETARRGLPKGPGNLPEHPPVRQPGAPSVPAAGSSARAHPGKSPPKHVSGVRLFRSTQGVKFTLFFVPMGDLDEPIGSYERTFVISHPNPNLPRARQTAFPTGPQVLNHPGPGPRVLGCNCPGAAWAPVGTALSPGCLRARRGAQAHPQLTYPQDIHRYEKLFVNQYINVPTVSRRIAVNC